MLRARLWVSCIHVLLLLLEGSPLISPCLQTWSFYTTENRAFTMWCYKKSKPNVKKYSDLHKSHRMCSEVSNGLQISNLQPQGITKCEAVFCREPTVWAHLVSFSYLWYSVQTMSKMSLIFIGSVRPVLYSEELSGHSAFHQIKYKNTQYM